MKTPEKEVKKIVLDFQEFLRKREYFVSDDGVCRTFEDLFEIFMVEYKKKKNEKAKR